MLLSSALTRHYGFEDAAQRALDAVLAFTPAIPNWAYMGSALGIGDFSNNALLTPYGGWERPLQHYRAGTAASKCPAPGPSHICPERDPTLQSLQHQQSAYKECVAAHGDLHCPYEQALLGA